MENISIKILDVYDDIELSGLKKIAFENIPNRVKNMEFLSNNELNKLVDDDFALVTLDKLGKFRRYPINNYENAWLSSHYFANTHSELSDKLAKQASKKIGEACRYYNIDLPELRSLEKKASNEIWALPSQGKYPITTKTQITEGLDYFEKYAAQMHPRHRHEFSANIQKQASRLKVNIDKYKLVLQKYASRTIAPEYKANLSKRMELVNDKGRKFLNKLAYIYISPEEIEKAAQIIESFDVKNSISQHWDKHIQNPYTTFYGIEKRAEYSFEASGQEFSDSELIAALTQNRSKFEEYFGKHVVDAIEKDPIAIVESMPDPNKEVLANLVKGQI
jgi:hypothetical protein